MNFPRISIITPSLNQGKYLEHTILSILNQDYPNLEYIVIDGGSTDNSLEIILKYEDKLDYWASEPDRGQADAINKGLLKATGEIINWINSDDLLEKKALAMVSKYFEKNPNLGFLHGKTIVFSRGKEKVIAGNPDTKPNKYLSGMSFPQPSAFFHRRVLDKIGLLDESLHYGMDYDFYVRIALNFPVLQVPDVLSRYRLHNESKTVQSKLKFAEEWLIVFNRVIRSILFPSNTLSAMKDLNLLNETDKVLYPVSNKYTDNQLEEYFLFFLYYQLHFRYECYDFEQCRLLLRYLRKNYYKYYKEQRLETITMRLKLGKTLIKTGRELFR